MDTLGARIKILRTKKGLTQEALGKLVHTSKSSVCQWENGNTKKMNGENLARLADVFNVSAMWLSTGKDGIQDTANKNAIVSELPAGYANTQSIESRPPVITDEEWKLVSPKTRALVEEILIKSNNQTLQDDDIKLLQDMADKLSNR